MQERNGAALNEPVQNMAGQKTEEDAVSSRITLYRKRLIPEEIVPLKSDELLYAGEDRLVTRWRAIHKRSDLDHGLSVYYLREGWKVSRFYLEDGSLKYTYCDIVKFDREGEKLIVTDLLADVTIDGEGRIEILDLDELAQAFDRGLISKAELIQALKQLNALLARLYAGDLKELEAPMLCFS